MILQPGKIYGIYSHGTHSLDLCYWSLVTLL
jgi:hypothetical protein